MNNHPYLTWELSFRSAGCLCDGSRIQEVAEHGPWRSQWVAIVSAMFCSCLRKPQETYGTIAGMKFTNIKMLWNSFDIRTFPRPWAIEPKGQARPLQKESAPCTKQSIVMVTNQSQQEMEIGTWGPQGPGCAFQTRTGDSLILIARAVGIARI